MIWTDNSLSFSRPVGLPVLMRKNPDGMICRQRDESSPATLSIKIKHTPLPIITGAELYSNAMEWALPEMVEHALIGCRFKITAMEQALQSANLAHPIYEDLCQMLKTQEI